MRKYYVRSAGKESGPFALDDLKYLKVTSDAEIRTDNGSWALIVKSDLALYFQNFEAIDTKEFEKRTEKSATPNSRIVIVLAVAILFATMFAGLVFFILSSK